MNINSDLLPLFNPTDDLKHPNESILTPLFSLLVATNRTVAPWIGPTFWSNMLNKEFFTYYFQDLFKELTNNSQIVSNPESLYARITTILHLIFTYHNGFPKELILPYYDKLINLKNPEISHMLIYLEKHSSSTDFLNIISRFDLSGINASAGVAIPLFTLYGLLHQLRLSAENQNNFLSIINDTTQTVTSFQNAIILLHLIQVLVSFFDFDSEKLGQLKESLNKFYCFDTSVSEISGHIIYLLKKATKYPGYGFHDLLNRMSQISEAFGCQIPLFFDSKHSNISTFLYNDTVDRSSFINSYITFPRFFIHRYFNLQPPSNLNELQRFMYNLQFNKKYLQTVQQNFNLSQADARYVRPVLTPPAHQFQFHRIITDFQMIPEMSTPYQQGKFLISSPVEALLNQAFFTPISQYFKTLEPNGSSEQQIVVIGSDYLLSTIITTIALWVLKNPAYNSIEFQIYFVPTNSSQFGDFISEKDIIYKSFVRNIYRTVNSILPSMDETSKAFFPKFVQTEGSSKYENNVWFNNPSPSHLFQFGIQHYLLFAQYKTDIYIWQCSITMSEINKVIIVPFVGSVVIDTADQKRLFDTNVYEYKNQQKQTESIETKTMALYNTNCEKRAKPNKDFLILDNGSLRLVSSAMIMTSRMKPMPFYVDIDGRRYGPANDISVSKMTGRLSEHMRMKIKTFVDIY